ncbi:hypothetical protein [Dishui Lake phycodnavirus 3]|nr:hypothetical protein [Dishui Lake phycodnavirus 3]
MSQRLGMADGRCFTINTSSQLLNNKIMEANKVPLVDNYAYRQLLQRSGPSLIDQIQSTQDRNDRCSTCDKPL